MYENIYEFKKYRKEMGKSKVKDFLSITKNNKISNMAFEPKLLTNCDSLK